MFNWLCLILSIPRQNLMIKIPCLTFFTALCGFHILLACICFIHYNIIYISIYVLSIINFLVTFVVFTYLQITFYKNNIGEWIGTAKYKHMKFETLLCYMARNIGGKITFDKIEQDWQLCHCTKINKCNVKFTNH